MPGYSAVIQTVPNDGNFGETPMGSDRLGECLFNRSMTLDDFLVINNINDIIKSLPEEQRLTKQMIGEIFGYVGTLMGIFNSWEINPIAKGVGENSRKINTIIDISDIHTEHLQNLKFSVDKISDILTAMLKNNPAHLITEIDRTL
jgi:hypothetical protein